MPFLFDKHVFLKHLEKLYLVLTMEEEIGAVEDISRVQVDCNDRQHTQRTIRDYLCFLSKQKKSVSSNQTYIVLQINSKNKHGEISR